ncbi:MAG TPA: hypothetical protein VHU40_22340, partial [Polyangia bacterium]|nr:hypothetical protein [Polyangia bacterium]
LVAGCASTAGSPPVTPPRRPAEITAIVVFPPLLGFGGPAERLRAARRTEDALVEATGGHAIFAEELEGRSPEVMVPGVRALGEDPQTTLTFSVSVVRSERLDSIGLAGSATAKVVRRYADFTVRLEVRRLSSSDVLGRVETFASALASAPELDASGKPQGLQKAIDIAVHDALARFAPRLKPGAPFPALAEIPAELEQHAGSGAPALVERLRRLVALYPELTLDELSKLATGRARFLIIRPGRLAAVGVQPGDLLNGVAGKPLGSRAALSRSLARGEVPPFSVERAGEHFLVGRDVKLSAIAK